MAYQKIDHTTTRQRLSVGFLADQGLWQEASDRFIESPLDTCSSIYDYLFRKLTENDQPALAGAMSEKYLRVILQSPEIEKYADQIPVVQFYMNLLASQGDPELDSETGE